MLNLTKHMDFTQFLTWTYIESNSNDYLHREFVQMKFSMGTLCLFALITIMAFFANDWSLGSTCLTPDIAESNSRSARVSVGQCLKFCDDTPYVATLSTLNNPQDLDPDYWRPVFRFSELRHMRVQVNNSVAWTVCQCSVLLTQEVIFWQMANVWQ